MDDDPTLDPGRRSWVPVAEGSPFPIQNLPLGIFRPPGGTPRGGVAIGDHVLDLSAVAGAGLLPSQLPPHVFDQPSLNLYLSLGRPLWRATRRRLADLLAEGEDALTDGSALHPANTVEMLLPVSIGDYVDFYSSLHHAVNLGRILRPDGEPLAPNWRQIPVGYHGRSGTVTVSGSGIHRPSGVREDADGIRFGPSQRLDIEVEVGFVTGPGNLPGQPIPVASAEERIFGICLLNDWSARDVQAFESRPLGPFLGKSFATSMSPWLVDLDALAPFRVEAPSQQPPPLAHLRLGPGKAGIDLRLEAEIEGTTLIRTNFREMYWTMAQQFAHATSNGATVRPGDLFGSGTVSGSGPGSQGSLLELTTNGARPVRLADGSVRTYLEDGDRVVLRGWCEAPGAATIGLGECLGTILPPSS